MAPKALLTFGRTVAGRELAAPPDNQILRPRPAAMRRFMRLHAQAGRIAETQPRRITHPAIIHALEQELILALVNCLVTRSVRDVGMETRQTRRLAMELESVLATDQGRLRSARDIAAAIGIAEPRLRAWCDALLGMTLRRYQRLRRLARTRIALQQADATSESCIDVVKRHGFADLHRFVTEYWTLFGEMPPLPSRNPAIH
jgi:AraC-like DNA-binding protein